MTVKELIDSLKNMPYNAQIVIMEGEKGQSGETRTPEPEQVWNDFAENYVVVL